MEGGVRVAAAERTALGGDAPPGAPAQAHQVRGPARAAPPPTLPRGLARPHPGGRRCDRARARRAAARAGRERARRPRRCGTPTSSASRRRSRVSSSARRAGRSGCSAGATRRTRIRRMRCACMRATSAASSSGRRPWTGPAAYQLFDLDRRAGVALSVLRRSPTTLTLAPARRLRPGSLPDHRLPRGDVRRSRLQLRHGGRRRRRRSRPSPATSRRSVPAVVGIAAARCGRAARPAVRDPAAALVPPPARGARSCSGPAASCSSRWRRPARRVAQGSGWSPGAVPWPTTCAAGCSRSPGSARGRPGCSCHARARDALVGGLLVATAGGRGGGGAGARAARARSRTRRAAARRRTALLGGHAFLWAIALNSFGTAVPRRWRALLDRAPPAGAGQPLDRAAAHSCWRSPPSMTRAGEYSFVYLGELVRHRAHVRRLQPHRAVGSTGRRRRRTGRRRRTTPWSRHDPRAVSRGSRAPAPDQARGDARRSPCSWPAHSPTRASPRRARRRARASCCRRAAAGRSYELTGTVARRFGSPPRRHARLPRARSRRHGVGAGQLHGSRARALPRGPRGDRHRAQARRRLRRRARTHCSPSARRSSRHERRP